MVYDVPVVYVYDLWDAGLSVNVHGRTILVLAHISLSLSRIAIFRWAERALASFELVLKVEVIFFLRDGPQRSCFY